MALGFTQAAGNDALYQLLAQRRAQALEQQRYGDKLRQQDIENQQRARQFDQTDAYRRDTLAEQKRLHDLQDEDRSFTQATTIANTLPAGFLRMGDPAVSTLQKGGMGALLTAAPTLPAMGPEFQGPSPDATVAEMQQGRPAGFLKSLSHPQRDKEADNARAAAQAEEQRRRDAEIGRHNRAMEARPQPMATVTIQTVDANGNPVTRVVKKDDAVGKDFAARPSAVSLNRADSAQTVAQTGEDIITLLRDPAVAAELGPEMGRYNTLREFIGNPPPALSQLAGQIESFALANMGVHGMRSAQGAREIVKLLDRKHTPASLAATIQGLSQFSKHFVENVKPKTGSKVTIKSIQEIK